jgi:hypothetical protein
VDTAQYEKIIGADTSTAPTTDRRRLERQSKFVTYPTAMAISSAAIAPSMGKESRGAFRFFLALLNLRLGVWLPNPRRIHDFSKRWPTKTLNIAWLPRPGYLVREMLGLNSIDARYLFVTDGGHYENLGLVELLRRRCRTIWCVDAAGDHADQFTTLGGALRQAQIELGVEIEIHPYQDMAPAWDAPSADGITYVKSPFCTGSIYYPDENGRVDRAPERTGVLHFVKLGVPNDAPWSVLSYASEHQHFPFDATLDQLFDAERFEAYRELGAHSMAAAIRSANGGSPGTNAGR